MKTAVIDIGSNSVRLMVDEGHVLNEKIIETTRLGEGLLLTGRLSDKSITATLGAIARLKVIAEDKGAENVLAFATQAVRRAENGKEFLSLAKEKTGLSIRLLSGEEEAVVGFLGAAGEKHCPVLVVDIGGGSTELITGESGTITYKKSFECGAVTLKDLCQKEAGKGADEQFWYAEEKAGEIFADAALPHYERIVLIGGTVSSLAAMDLGLSEYDPYKVHGYGFLEGLSPLIGRVIESPDLIKEFPSLQKERADIILYGLAILSALFSKLENVPAEVSEKDNLEGYLEFIK